MEKIKNILSSNKSHEREEEKLYGTSDTTATKPISNTGTISGEGSHLGIARGNEGSVPTTGGTETMPGTYPSAGIIDTEGLSGHPAGGSLTGTKGVGAVGGELTGRGTYADPSIPSSTTAADGAAQTSSLSSGATAGSHISNFANGSGNSGSSYQGAYHPHPGESLSLGLDAAGQIGDGSHLDQTNTRRTQGTGQTGGGYNNSDTSGGSHLGGAAAGSALTSGLQERRDNGSGPHSSLHHTGPSIGEGGGLSGPHSTTTANRLDPSINTSGPIKLEHGITHHKHHGGGAEAADKDHANAGRAVHAGVGSGGAQLADQERQKYQIDRDTAGGASGHEHSGTSTQGRLDRDATAGFGGLGLADHEHQKTQISGGGLQHPGGDVTAGLAGAAVAGHEYNKHSKSTPSTTATGNTGATTTRLNGNNLSRESAIAGGLGTAGTRPGTHHQSNLGAPSASAITGQPVTSSGPQTGTQTQGTTGTGNTGAVTARHGDTEQSHLGRDAAVGAGVGGAAYEAGKYGSHGNDKDLKHAEKDAKKEHKEEVKQQKHDEKHDGKERKDSKLSGLLGFLHRDKNKKYSKEEEEEYERQEPKHHNQHGSGKELAGVAGAAGVGTGAYEAKEHAGGHSGTQTQAQSQIADKNMSEASRDQDGKGLPGTGTDHEGKGLKDKMLPIVGLGHKDEEHQRGEKGVQHSGSGTSTQHQIQDSMTSGAGSGIETGTGTGTGVGANIKGGVMSESGYGIAKLHHAGDDQGEGEGLGTGVGASGASGSGKAEEEKEGKEENEEKEEGREQGEGKGLGHSKHDSGYQGGLSEKKSNTTTKLDSDTTTGTGTGTRTDATDKKTGMGLTGTPTTYSQTGHKIAPSTTDTRAETHQIPTSGPGLSGNTKFSSTGLGLDGEKLGSEQETSVGRESSLTGGSKKRGGGDVGEIARETEESSKRGGVNERGVGSKREGKDVGNMIKEGKRSMDSNTGVENSAAGKMEGSY